MKLTYHPDKTFTAIFDGLSRDDLNRFLAGNGIPSTRVAELANAAIREQVLANGTKREIEREAEREADRIEVEKLLEQHCIERKDSRILYSALYDLLPNGWSHHRFSKALPCHLQPVSKTGNRKYVFNLALKDKQ